MRRRDGFTLVEMMVAVMILAVGLLAMVSTSAYVVRQIGAANQQANAANVLQSRVEKLRSIPCDSVKNMTAVTRGVTEKITRGTTANRVLTVFDTVTYSVNGSWAGPNKDGRKTAGYTIMVPCW